MKSRWVHVTFTIRHAEGAKLFTLATLLCQYRVKCLGLILDRRLTWKCHLLTLLTKGINCVRCVSYWEEKPKFNCGAVQNHQIQKLWKVHHSLVCDRTIQEDFSIPYIGNYFGKILEEIEGWLLLQLFIVLSKFAGMTKKSLPFPKQSLNRWVCRGLARG